METETVLANRSREFGLDPCNFRIDSTGWREWVTPNGILVKISPNGEVLELLQGELAGEQLFTLEAALAETFKCGKLIPTRKQWNEIISGIRGDIDLEGSWQDDVSIRNVLGLRLAGYRDPSSGAVYYLGSRAFVWSSSRDGAIRRFGRRLPVTRDQIHPVETCSRASGYSVRCLVGNLLSG